MFPVAPELVIPAAEPRLSVPMEDRVNDPPDITLVPMLRIAPAFTVWPTLAPIVPAPDV